MTEELDILKIIADNPEISQRKIAEQTGISLGQVNFLIKKCVKKGLLKLEGQTSKSIKYNLTPKGLAEKTALTLEYVKVSYNAIQKLTENIKIQIEQLTNEKRIVVVYGPKDEMMDIVKMVLGNKGVYIFKDSEIPDFDNNKTYICWEEDAKRYLESKGLKAVNLLG